MKLPPPAAVLVADEVGGGSCSVIAVTVSIGRTGQSPDIHAVAPGPTCREAAKPCVSGAVSVKVAGEFTVEAGVCAIVITIVADLMLFVVDGQV